MTLVQTSPTHIYMAKEEVVSDMMWPCDAGFHVPLQSEVETLYNIWVNLWIWSSRSWEGFNTYLKMPFAWYRVGSSSSVASQGDIGFYWANGANNPGYSYLSRIQSNYSSVTYNWQRYTWVSIRAFKDTPVAPDSSWTALYSDKIYHNSTLWLISVKNWSSWITIQDKNVWATTVYNSWDTLSEDNCGKYYQRWNNYWFPWTWSVTTSWETVNASTYWPWNYYNDSTFRLSPQRDSSNNQNLRWWVTQWSWTVTVDKEITSVRLWTTKVRPAYKPRTFTISRTEKSNMSSGWTYSDDAAWLTAGDGAFDDFFWYYGCRLNASGVETAKITQEESWWAWKLDITQLWTLTSGDNVMIAFPVMWIKMSKSWSTVTLSITDWLGRENEWYQYYAHSTWTLSSPWTPKGVFYLGAYKWYSSSNVIKSWSGQSPTVSQTQLTAITNAKANGSWYNIIGFYQRMFVNCLYMMKYGSPDSQTKVGKWYTGWSAKVNTGWTNSQTNATYGTTSATVQAKLFWLEDWWGNIHEWIWWVYTYWSKNLYTQLSWYSWVVSGWESTWSTIQTTSWNDLSSIVWNNKVLFWPSATVYNTNYNTDYCDYVLVNAPRLASAGGYWYEGSSAGAFYLYVNYDASSSNAHLGSRLMYLNWLT